jgi:diguanylate cyclase (GGDEF)-like protein
MKQKKIKTFKKIIADEAFLKALSDIGIYITNYETDENLPSHYWNNIKDQFQVDRTSAGFLENIHPEDRKRVSESLRRKREGKSQQFDETYRLKQSDGSYLWIKSKGLTVHSKEDGKPLIIVGSDTDISDLKLTEKELQKSIKKEKEHSEELELMRQMSATFSSSLDINETVQNILEEMRRIIPFQTGAVQLLKDSYLEIIGGWGFKDITKIKSMRFKYPDKGSLSTKALQQRAPVLTKDIEKDFSSFIQPDENMTLRSWIGIPLITGGEIMGLMTLDHTEKGKFNKHHLELAGIIGDHIAIALENSLFHERAYKMAMEDALTGAGSRHRLQLEGRLLFETAIRSNSHLSVAFIDIDRFKLINDEYGHGTGDQVLKRIAELCIQILRITDLFVRFGGEEFVMIFPDTEKEEALNIIERIRAGIQEIKHPEFNQQVTVSAGLYSACPEKGSKLSSFIAKADKALYLSKETGRNKSTMFSD